MSARTTQTATEPGSRVPACNFPWMSAGVPAAKPTRALIVYRAAWLAENTKPRRELNKPPRRNQLLPASRASCLLRGRLYFSPANVWSITAYHQYGKNHQHDQHHSSSNDPKPEGGTGVLPISRFMVHRGPSISQLRDLPGFEHGSCRLHKNRPFDQ